MWDMDRVRDIIDTNMVDFSARVAGLALTPAPPGEIPGAWCICLSVKGTYQFRLLLHAGKGTLEDIAQRMKRAPASEEDIPLYAMEFFNILGGRIISEINQKFRQSARFTPPAFLHLPPAQTGGDCSLTLFYRYGQAGRITVEAELSADEPAV